MTSNRRVAGNEVINEQGLSFSPGVVEMDAEGNAVKAYTLDGEMPQTSWIGGRIEILRVGNGKLRAFKDNNEI